MISSINPLIFFGLPFSTCIETAPFPLVFQGILGFNLTSLGYPITSKFSSANFFTRAQAKYVVHPPFMESVSSIPIQIFSHPILLYRKCFSSPIRK